MTDTSTAKLIGTALIVSEDAVATRQLAEAMQELALSAEVCIKVSDALDRVNRSKLEVVVIDFSLGNQATHFLEQVRGSASNRTAITFAITSSSAETTYALKAGSSFALERPLTPDSIRHTLTAAYGLIVRERRPLLPLSYLRPSNRKQKGRIRGLRQDGKHQRTRCGIKHLSSANAWHRGDDPVHSNEPSTRYHGGLQGVLAQ